MQARCSSRVRQRASIPASSFHRNGNRSGRRQRRVGGSACWRPNDEHSEVEKVPQLTVLEVLAVVCGERHNTCIVIAYGEYTLRRRRLGLVNLLDPATVQGKD